MARRGGLVAAAEGTTAASIAAALVVISTSLTGCTTAPPSAPATPAAPAAAPTGSTFADAAGTGSESADGEEVSVLTLVVVPDGESQDSTPTRVQLPSATAGPLELILGWSPEADPTTESVITQASTREDLILACMADLGLPYWPQVPDADQIVITEAHHVPAEGTLAFAARYGYGVWTTPEHLIDVDITSQHQLSVEEQTYFDSLTADERNAYLLALYGTDPSTGEHTTGCYQRSSLAPLASARLTVVRDAAAAFVAALPSRPEFDVLDAQWSRCMALAGFAETSPAQAAARLVALKARGTEPGGIPLPWVIPASDLIAEDERAVAQADHVCREETGYPQRFAAISSQLQLSYLDQHRTDLVALAQALRTEVEGG